MNKSPASLGGRMRRQRRIHSFVKPPLLSPSEVFKADFNDKDQAAALFDKPAPFKLRSPTHLTRVENILVNHFYAEEAHSPAIDRHEL